MDKMSANNYDQPRLYDFLRDRGLSHKSTVETLIDLVNSSSTSNADLFSGLYMTLREVLDKPAAEKAANEFVRLYQSIVDELD